MIRGYSPRDTYALYQDAVEDEYPMYFLRKRGSHWLVYDEEAVYVLGQESTGLTFIEHQVHGAGVAPVVRYSNQIDLEGRTPGEAEPLIPLAKRINKDTFDRMTAQHFNSWKVRTAVGLEDPKTPEEAEQRKLILRQGDILTGGTGVQFGTLDETKPDGLIASEERDIATLAAVSQTPTHSLTGDMINLSADAITEARAMLDMKAGERKVGFGDSHAQTLRLAAHIEGRSEDAADFNVVIDWTDFQSRSMAQAADALGKLATQLGIPQEKLWDRIPGVTPDVAAEWERYKRANRTLSSRSPERCRRRAAADGADGGRGRTYRGEPPPSARDRRPRGPRRHGAVEGPRPEEPRRLRPSLARENVALASATRRSRRRRRAPTSTATATLRASPVRARSSPRPSTRR